MRRRVLLYELNEVPWEVVDLYVAARPRSNLAKLLPRAMLRTTTNTDPVDLMPWRTWPTFHTSLYTPDHNSYDQGQDPATFSKVFKRWVQATLLESIPRAYERFVGDLAGDASAWHALPREASAWWRARAASSLVRDGEGWRVEGPAAERATIRRGAPEPAYTPAGPVA